MGDIPPETREQATNVLFFLETIDWKWDINTLLNQPNELFNAILKLLIAGRKLQKQNQKKAALTDEA